MNNVIKSITVDYSERPNRALNSATKAARSFGSAKRTSSDTFPESHSFNEPIGEPLD